MNLLEGKKGIVIGVANDRSICWGIADECLKQGAKVAISYLDITESRVRDLIDKHENKDNAIAEKCDVSSDESIKSFFEFVKKEFGTIDFIVCAPAFCNKECLKGDYMNVSRGDFLQAMEISVYALTAICKTFEPILNDGGSVITLSYYGAEKYVQNYNVMGVAKAALEASVRYLAYDFGKRKIRVNSISAGPVKTLAASAIGEFRKILEYCENTSPLKSNVSVQEISNTAMYLLSDLSSGITAENIHCDCGVSSVGLYQQNKADNK